MSDYSKSNPVPVYSPVSYVEHIYDSALHGSEPGTYDLSDSSVLNPGEAVMQSFLAVEVSAMSISAPTISFGYEDSDPDNVLDDTSLSALTLNAVLAGQQLDTADSLLLNSTAEPMQLKVQVKDGNLSSGKIKIIEKRIKIF